MRSVRFQQKSASISIQREQKNALLIRGNHDFIGLRLPVAWNMDLEEEPLIFWIHF